MRDYALAIWILIIAVMVLMVIGDIIMYSIEQRDWQTTILASFMWIILLLSSMAVIAAIA